MSIDYENEFLEPHEELSTMQHVIAAVESLRKAVVSVRNGDQWGRMILECDKHIKAAKLRDKAT